MGRESRGLFESIATSLGRGSRARRSYKCSAYYPPRAGMARADRSWAGQATGWGKWQPQARTCRTGGGCGHPGKTAEPRGPPPAAGCGWRAQSTPASRRRALGVRGPRARHDSSSAAARRDYDAVSASSSVLAAGGLARSGERVDVNAAGEAGSRGPSEERRRGPREKEMQADSRASGRPPAGAGRRAECLVARGDGPEWRLRAARGHLSALWSSRGSPARGAPRRRPRWPGS